MVYEHDYDGHGGHADTCRACEIATLQRDLEFQAACTKALLPYQDEAVALRTRVETLETSAKAAKRLLLSVAGWDETDWQGLKYHALEQARELESALRRPSPPRDKGTMTWDKHFLRFICGTRREP